MTHYMENDCPHCEIDALDSDGTVCALSGWELCLDCAKQHREERHCPENGQCKRHPELRPVDGNASECPFCHTTLALYEFIIIHEPDSLLTKRTFSVKCANGHDFFEDRYTNHMGSMVINKHWL